MEEIKKIIQPCDLILRRYNNYLDGLIFSENSYFTHVGIYCDQYKGISSQVLHAEAEPGVHMSSLDEFCNCDDIAIVRFSFKGSEQEKDMLSYIINEFRPGNDKEEIKNKEIEVFEELIKKTKPKNNHAVTPNNLNAEGYAHLILDRAISLLGARYDLKFNFNNFDEFSCIEYVWYCLKPLYPLHRISVADFEFFQLIKIPVIVPDVFIRNDFFEYIYSSIPGVNSQKELIENTTPDHWQFWEFVAMVFFWDVIFLVLSYFVFHTYFHMY